jgi:transposase InsO family protein
LQERGIAAATQIAQAAAAWKHRARNPAVGSWSQGFKTLSIEPGAPWQNSCTESFNARFTDEFLNVELFSSKLEAKVLSAEHREKYNNHRPHSSLEGMTPGEFAARYLAPLRPKA